MKIFRDVKESSAEMDPKMEKITDLIRKVASSSTETKDALANMSVSITELYLSIEKIVVSCLLNNESITNIENLVIKFKIEETAD